MSEILSLEEKRRIALFLNRAEGIWEGFGSVTPGDISSIVSRERTALTATTINGMLSLLGYHETLRALNAGTRNEAILSDLSFMWSAIEDGDIFSAENIHARLSNEIPADIELADAGGHIARLKITGR